MDPLQPSRGEPKGAHESVLPRLFSRDPQTQKKREEEFTAHKYEGLTIFQRTSPRSRRDCGDTALPNYKVSKRGQGHRNYDKKKVRSDILSPILRGWNR